MGECRLLSPATPVPQRKTKHAGLWAEDLAPALLAVLPHNPQGPELSVVSRQESRLISRCPCLLPAEPEGPGLWRFVFAGPAVSASLLCYFSHQPPPSSPPPLNPLMPTSVRGDTLGTALGPLPEPLQTLHSTMLTAAHRSPRLGKPRVEGGALPGAPTLSCLKPAFPLGCPALAPGLLWSWF